MHFTWRQCAAPCFHHCVCVEASALNLASKAVTVVLCCHVCHRECSYPCPCGVPHVQHFHSTAVATSCRQRCLGCRLQVPKPSRYPGVIWIQKFFLFCVLPCSFELYDSFFHLQSSKLINLFLGLRGTALAPWGFLEMVCKQKEMFCWFMKCRYHIFLGLVELFWLNPWNICLTPFRYFGIGNCDDSWFCYLLFCQFCFSCLLFLQ